MAKPSDKSDEINKIILQTTGIDRVKVIQNHQCAFKCIEPRFSWRDELSRKEYLISGLCQNCQDDTFGVPV